ncbi:MAG: DUF4091 domain-containing protein [Kiritimatiellia bacterium]
MKLFPFSIGLLCTGLMAQSLVAGPARKALYEPEGQKQATAANLFSRAKTSAKDTWSNRSSDLAVNGNLDANDHWASDSLPAWHQLDMGKVQRLRSIRVVPYWPDGRIYKFTVEGSEDGQTWKMLADQRANSINAGAVGFTLNFEPTACRYVRTTFTNSTAGQAGHLVEIEGFAEPMGAGARLIPVSTRERFDRDRVSALPETSPDLSLYGWRGERVRAQLLIESLAGFDELTVEPCQLKTDKGQSFPVQIDFIRYTQANGRLVADILDGTAQTTFKGIVRPVMLSINIPSDAQGIAEGTFVCRVNGKRLEAKISLTIDALTLPAPAQWKTHTDFWQHPDAVARLHDVPMWSDEHFALLRPSMKRLAEMGQKTITTTFIDEAWGGQTYDRFRSMVQWTRNADGSWFYDYTDFDRWVTFMMSCGITQQISCYSMLTWSLSFPYYDAAKGKTVSVRLQPGSPEYTAHWGPFLKDFVNHLRSKGWLEITRIALDERPDYLVRPTLDLVHRVAPELKIVAACDSPSNINELYEDVSYSYNVCEKAAAVAEQRRSEGKTTTFYICVQPSRPNTFLVSDLAESEWLPVMAANYGFDGVLRWAWHSWVENPLVSTDFTSWPSGDTALVYPGDRSSLRAEAFRDGIETFEKIAQLRALAQQRFKSGKLASLETALKTFSVAEGKKQGVHAADLQQLDDALRAAARALRPTAMLQPKH